MQAYASDAYWNKYGSEFHMALNVIFFIQQNEEITLLLYRWGMILVFICNHLGMEKELKG